MGKKSTKENKNIYQLSRETLELTRDQASALLGYISADRIEKIENERSLPHPEEILTMSKCYKAPNLCNHYCSQQCPIGQEYVPEVKMKALSQIVLEVVNSLNSLERAKNRLIEITVDGEISPNEYEDFFAIQKQLTQISLTVDALQLWFEKNLAEGKIDPDKFHKASLD